MKPGAHVLLLASAAVLAALALALSARPASGPASFVINLRRNADRLARFRGAYARSDMGPVPLQRVEAVDGARLGDADLVKLLTPDAFERLRAMRASGVRQDHPDLTPGAVGCYLSHVDVWRRLAAGGAPYAFVFEDDAAPPRDTLARFEAARAQIPAGWDLLLLGYEGDGEPRGPGTRRVSEFRRTHAYVVSAAAARKLLASALPISQQVDWELSARIRSAGLGVYGTVPELVPADWQGTDVQSPLRDE